jgi:predicted NACHT family NTPase
MDDQREQARAKWRDLISEQQQSGKSIAGFCRQRGIRAWQFYEWKKRLSEAEASQFLEVRIRPTAESRQSAAWHDQRIEIRLNHGRSLVVEPGFDAHHLRALLAVLESEA